MVFLVHRQRCVGCEELLDRNHKKRRRVESKKINQSDLTGLLIFLGNLGVII